MGKYADEQAQYNTMGMRADAEIDALTAQIVTLGASNTELASLVNSLDRSLSEASVTLSAQQAQISSQIIEINQKNTLLAQKDATIDNLLTQLANATQSTVPAGYTSLMSFIPAGGSWIDGLRLATGKVWVPAGRYEFNGWKQVVGSTPAQKICLTIAKEVTALDGPGPDQVVFYLRPNSSEWTAAQVNAGATTPVSVLQQTGGQIKHMSGFTLEMTPQGHNYHGWSLYNPPSGVVVDNVVTIGSAGTGGAPPLETFQATIHGGFDHIVKNCIFDGKMAGAPAAAVNLTFQDSINSFAEDCTFIDGQASMFVAYQCFNSGTRRCKVYAPTNAVNRFASAIINAGERTAGDLHEDIEMYGGVYKKSEHFSHSNDLTDGVHYTDTKDGVNYTTNNGSLTIRNPVTWPDWWNKAATGATTMVTPATLFTGDFTGIIVATWGTRTVRADGSVYYKYGPKSTSIETTYSAPQICTVVNGVTKQLAYDWVRYGVHLKPIKYPYTAVNPA